MRFGTLKVLMVNHGQPSGIPDDAYVVAPNRFNITDFDFASDDTMSSADLRDLD